MVQAFLNKQKQLKLKLLTWSDLIKLYNFDNINKKYNDNKGKTNDPNPFNLAR